MRIAVVTGCLGFIGSHLTDRLLQGGWFVYGIDAVTYVSNIDLIKKWKLAYENFKFVQQDIVDLEWLPDCDVVFNLAAESHVANSISDGTKFIHTNVGGVERILNLIKSKPTNVSDRPLFFHFSTDEIYGDTVYGDFDETSPPKPSNPYSASKASADMLIQSYNRTYDIDYMIIRPTNNWGKRQYPEKLIPLAIKLLQRGKKIRLHDKGEPVRSWIYVEDTVDACLTILEKGQKNEIYNLAGEEYKNIDIVDMILWAYDRSLILEDWTDLSHKRPGQDIRYALNDTKLQNLGWIPQNSLENEKLWQDVVDWYKLKFRW